MMFRIFERTRGAVVSWGRSGKHGFPRLTDFSTVAGADTSNNDRNGPLIGQDDIPKLVIFDKNGTLTDFNAKWSPWIQNTTMRIRDMTGLDVSGKVYDQLGFCDLTQKTKPGLLLAEATVTEIKHHLIDILQKEGMNEEEAAWTVEQIWEEVDSERLVKLDDLVTLFRILTEEGIKIAVATRESRTSALQAMKNLGLRQYISAMVCGDDVNTKARPSGHNIKLICQMLNINPQDTVLIGDTANDMIMGRNAGAGAVVGVLSGIGTIEDLKPIANNTVNSVMEVLPLILPEAKFRECVERHGLVAKKKEAHLPGRKKSLVIFDKDGTLICFHSMWRPWIMKLSKRLENATGLKLADTVFERLGFSKETDKFLPGVVAEGTQTDVQNELFKILEENGISHEEARSTVQRVWDGCEVQDSESLKSVGDVLPTFKKLKQYGIRIAVCTSDSRQGTMETLDKLGLMEYVDALVCGDDARSETKPSPQNAYTICDALNVDPSDTVMVGDTLADIGMGRSANLGATVAVLTGVCGPEELADADHVVPSAIHVLPIVLPDDHHNLGNVDTSTNLSVPQTRSYSTCHQSSPKLLIARNSRYHQCNQPIRRQYSTNSLSKKYDYVIVGAGSAGCVLANRLTEDQSKNVLLLEAGPKDYWWNWKIHMPAALMYNLCNDNYNWFYHTVPQKNVDNRVMYQPRGRVWGGSSSLNAMVYIRGHALDYDRWESEGARGWSYANCLPYFKKSQTHELGENDYRGGSGPLQVSRGKTGHPLHKAFIEAGVQAGYPYTEDMNGFCQEGMGEMDMTIHKGRRWNTSQAYLRPALSRPNLDTETKAFTTRVLFSDDKATGVEYEQNGELKRIEANEVILSGGAINSPQLLMLSGIGNADELKALDIPVQTHLPGVGENLQDHLDLYIQQKCVKPITLYTAQWKFPHNMVKIGLQWLATRTGWGATAHLESGGLIRSRPGIAHPDIQYHFLPSVVLDHGRTSGNCHAYQVHASQMRQTSIGNIKLKSKNPKDHPLIDPNYLATEIDIWELRQSVKLSREILAQKAFDEYRGEEISPGPSVVTDDEIDAWVRQATDTAYHPSCTCKMGSTDDPMTVVDNQGRVLGIDGLRVVDSSIMPSVVSGNLNGPTVMIAEKIADAIRGRDPLPPSDAAVWKPETLETQR
ncbi:unnamed protein product [Owenia fusiformis]|uniref:Choline dehydrogenase n=1 Tax=Owenia fusiformis TaxID=6347 RepID=A0A8J1TTC4_OWEFU|nr:unnamed protein product [Owenia fusiformis]